MELTQVNENLSQWFNPAEQQPWVPGVYAVECSDGFRFSEWNGEKWGLTTRDKCYACDWRGFYGKHTETACEIYAWYGLASDPSAKPKPKARGNRRVTRYVVMLDKNPVAVFDARKECLDYVKRGNVWWSSIEKIRFRTPEAD